MARKKPPRIGVTWRSAAEEKVGRRRRFEDYLGAVREAGGEPVEISLMLPADELRRVAASLDAVVLSGSGADVDPRRYGTARGPHTADADRRREATDRALLDDALATGKPVLAICFGIQSLNVHLHGTLVQDIASEIATAIHHDREENRAEARHPVRVEGGRLAEVARRGTLVVNSSHHQSVLKPGRGLQVTARAPDGVIEAVEWTGDAWVVGVQWHPERMHGDAAAHALFEKLVAEAGAAAARR